MEWAGMISFFITGFLWSWGAETSRKIKDMKVDAPYGKIYSFLGLYHRLNRFLFSLFKSSFGLSYKWVQPFLGGVFFLPFFMVFGNWPYLLFLCLGGGSFLVIQRVFPNC